MRKSFVVLLVCFFMVITCDASHEPFSWNDARSVFDLLGRCIQKEHEQQIQEIARQQEEARAAVQAPQISQGQPTSMNVQKTKG
jgi:hypothetical protein